MLRGGEWYKWVSSGIGEPWQGKARAPFRPECYYVYLYCTQLQEGLSCVVQLLLNLDWKSCCCFKFSYWEQNFYVARAIVSP